ncbi:MAG: energy transducer TonB [Acidobacteria bacterium]|nr:energy transducer TonB [Acidobacteriota bacterium]
MKILEQPVPALPEDYGTLDAQGSIPLRVRFLENGTVGEIRVLSSFLRRLTDLAVEAAKKIKFEPAVKNGKPVVTVKTVIYSYIYGGWQIPGQSGSDIYYCEGDPNLKKPAALLEDPKVDFPAARIIEKGGGQIKITVVLKATGEVVIVKTDSDLPEDFTEKVKAAVLKIKFNPAIDKSGKPVSQLKTFEYEFKPNQ